MEEQGPPYMGFFFICLGTLFFNTSSFLRLLREANKIEAYRSEVNNLFYQNCFKDEAFTNETHKLFHQTCINLKNDSMLAKTLPPTVISQLPNFQDSYDKLKLYLDTQHTLYNFTECFKEQLENHYIALNHSKNSMLMWCGIFLFEGIVAYFFYRKYVEIPRYLRGTLALAYIMNLFLVGYLGGVMCVQFLTLYNVPQDSIHDIIDLC